MHITFLAKLKAYKAYPLRRKERSAYENGFKAAWQHTHALTDMEAKMLYLSYLIQVSWSFRHSNKGKAVAAGIAWIKKNCVRVEGQPKSLWMLRGFLARTGEEEQLKLFVVNECGWTPNECREWCSCESLSIPDMFPEIETKDILTVDILLCKHEEETI